MNRKHIARYGHPYLLCGGRCITPEQVAEARLVVMQATEKATAEWLAGNLSKEQALSIISLSFKKFLDTVKS